MEYISSFFDSIYAFWNQLVYAVKNITILDILDILIVTFILYKAIEFLRDTRAGQLVKGIALLFVAFFVASALSLVSLKWLLAKVVDYIIIILVIVFQPELRRLLERMGRSNIGFLSRLSEYDVANAKIKHSIDEICKAVSLMSDKRIGALIVFERKTMLSDIANTGTVLGADASYELVCNLFFPKSPLHDGALIVREGTLLSAGCILPLTANNQLNSQLGTRHRAAIGMSENSDAIVLVVSEETGNISLAVNGRIHSDYNLVTLKEELYSGLLTENDKKKNLFSDIFSKFRKNKQKGE